MTELGIFCLLYFVLIRLAMGKWTSTFAGFWAAAGIGCLAVRLLTAYLPEWLETVVWFTFSVAVFIFLAVEIRIFSELLNKQEKKCDYLIVLGAHIEGDQVTNSLKRRLDKAMQYKEKFPKTRIIVSGGRGTGETVTEAEAMKKYLQQHGIKESCIEMEDQSTTTKENLAFSAAMLPDMNCPVGIVTNNFHIYRARQYARKLGYQNTCGIPAGCSRILLLNYAVREFFVVWKMWILG